MVNKMTITIHWWIIPTFITVGGVIWALTHKDTSSYLSGLGNLLLLIPVLGVSLIAWVIAAFYK